MYQETLNTQMYSRKLIQAEAGVEEEEDTVRTRDVWKQYQPC